MNSSTRCRSIRRSRPTAAGTSAGSRSMPTTSSLSRSRLNRFRFSKPCCRTALQCGARGRDLRMARRHRGDGGRPARCGRPRRCPGDRLRPHRNRHRRNVPGRRPARLCRSADRARQRSISLLTSISSRWRGPSRPWARKGFGPIEQSQFLRRLGIEQRAATLKAKAARAADIDQALARLIGRERTAMGELFKVAAFAHPSIGTPPGFEANELAA